MTAGNSNHHRRWWLLLCVALVAACPAAPKHARLVDAPADGDVAGIVKAREAAAGDRRVLVYVGASWCEPCQRFHEAAEKGALDDMLGHVDLVVFDLDRDRERLEAAGYGSRMIPLIVVPGADGRATDKRMEGSVKGDRAVAEMTPRLRSLLE